MPYWYLSYSFKTRGFLVLHKVYKWSIQSIEEHIQNLLTGWDAINSISPNLPISLDKFLFEYASQLATISPLMIFVTLSKSIFSNEVWFFSISFTVTVHMAFARFCALLFSSHINVRFGVVGGGIMCSNFRERTMWSKIPWILGQKNKQWPGISVMLIFA